MELSARPLSPPSSATFRSPPRTSPAAVPVSRLQLIQARFQSKLLQEKQQKMMQLFPNNNNNNNNGGNGFQPVQGGGGGGTVRQFFAQRRAHHGSGGGHGFLNSSLNSSMGGSGGGPVSLNGSWSSGTFAARGGVGGGPKQGSPVGWDKSYPLSPLDRDGSGSSSNGYDSTGSGSNGFYNGGGMSMPPNVGGGGGAHVRDGGRRAVGRGGGQRGPRRAAAAGQWKPTDPGSKVPGRRAPSLDRYGAGRNSDGGRGGPNDASQHLAGMRRTNSQILTTSTAAPSVRDKENAPRTLPPATRGLQAKLEPASSQAGFPKQRAMKPPNVIGGQRSPQAAPSPSDARDGGGLPLPKTKKAPVPDIAYKSPPKTNSKQRQASSPVHRAPSSALDPNLAECGICGRRFAKDRIEKHEAICKKSTTKKRKPFDPTTMRIKGTDLEEFVRKSARSGHRTAAAAPAATHQQQTSGKKADWRSKHNQFIEAIRQAKAVQKHMAAGGKASDLPPPPPMDTSDYIRCPHCDRKFSEGAAERHIPKCKNIKSNKKTSIRRE